ncbi:hypothetical protein G3545_12235 [Starkeya sp. ORNL1]|uniref:hypothetical protein n=1 Tax=Starkeya sp. ORNL1 TaxID=2709380 RepID=UPI0014630429|nr:hypothetical protein [Starkeya sp. ORNL1]QJP14344.1 hypothetical protein G3545_12235 [Starkeya sp. ORNL1]
MSGVIPVKDILAAMDALRTSLARYEHVTLTEKQTWYWEVLLGEQSADCPYPEKLGVGDLEEDLSYLGELHLAEGSPGVFAYKLASVPRYLGTKELDRAD